MKNIVWYVKEYGKYTFAERPFTDVDSFILSSVSYMMFEGLIPELGNGKPPVAVASLRSEFVINRLVVNTMDPSPNRKLWKLFIDSPRFRDLKAGWLRSVTDTETTKQFAAMTFLLPDGRLHVCYRGTDLTLLGWKEDFNMSYLEEVPAQTEAVAYLDEIAREGGKGIYVGGHSKGGNLAVYAAMHCEKAVKERILAVYNCDGPGFHSDVFETETYREIAERVYKIIPCDDLVGILLYHERALKIVRSRGFFILQHDPYNWEIAENGTFRCVDSTTAASGFYNKTAKRWIAAMDDRPRFIDLLFYVLGSDDGVTVVDYRKRPVYNLRQIKDRYDRLDPDSKAFFSEGMKLLFRSGKDSLFSRTKSGKDGDRVETSTICGEIGERNGVTVGGEASGREEGDADAVKRENGETEDDRGELAYVYVRPKDGREAQGKENKKGFFAKK